MSQPMRNVDVESLHKRSPWTFECPICGLPFMQSFQYHNERYHNGRLTQ